MMGLSPRRSLTRAEWLHAYRVARVRIKISTRGYRPANVLAMGYATTIVRVPTWQELNVIHNDANYVARARAAIA